MVNGKYIVGIDPSKAKHQAAVIDTNGIQIGKAFTFKTTYQGYHQDLWHRLQLIIPNGDRENILFAIETACNLWQTLSFYLKAQGSVERIFPKFITVLPPDTKTAIITQLITLAQQTPCWQ